MKKMKFFGKLQGFVMRVCYKIKMSNVRFIISCFLRLLCVQQNFDLFALLLLFCMSEKSESDVVASSAAFSWQFSSSPNMI